MEHKRKIGATVFCASLIALALLVAIPSGPFVNISNTIVSASPDFDNYTRINIVGLRDEEMEIITTFTENDTTQNVDVGTLLHHISVGVFLKKEYADNETAATDYTRVYVTIKNPSDATIYENDLAISYGEDNNTHWSLWYYGEPSPDIELTAGTWTITTKYEVYA